MSSAPKVDRPRYHFLSALRTFSDLSPERVLVAGPSGRLTAADLWSSSRSVAGWLKAHGVAEGEAIGLMLWNRPAFLQSFFAALHLGARPGNVNPRYGSDEAQYVVEDCRARAVIADPDCADAARAAAAAARHEVVVLVAEGPEWEQALRHEPAPEREPTSADTLLVYTGGTTGNPRAVVWEIEPWYRMLWEIVRPDTDPPEPELIAKGVRSTAPTVLPASPLAHGAALGLALNGLDGGGTVVLTEASSFDAASTLRLVRDHGVKTLGIIGDAYARPLVAELTASDWASQLPSLSVITSSGAVLTPELRDELQRLLPGVRVLNNYGSSEGLLTRNDGETRGFRANGGMVVLDENDRPLPAGSGVVGMIATSGNLPLGYLNETEKSAQIFRVIDGRRYAILGDAGVVEPDGSITVLGRGDTCINTGGEKVWPEEVERAIRKCVGIADAGVVGMPDEKWGQRVVAVVALESGATLDADSLKEQLRTSLAGYKLPKQWFEVAEVPRTHAGKVNYGEIRRVVMELMS